MSFLTGRPFSRLRHASRRVIQNSLLVVAGVAVALVIAETILRAINPPLLMKEIRVEDFTTNPIPWEKTFTLDPEFGLRPFLLGVGYSAYGTHVNAYPIQKTPGKRRLLFLGDSVTARAKIIDALKRIYGEEKYEFWNAGVEAFSTEQEVGFYKKFNFKINPDHVILSFHNNDFKTTPLAFFNGENKLVVYLPNASTMTMSRWLFQNSFCYRHAFATYFRLTFPRHQVSPVIDASLIRKVEGHLADLRDVLSQGHIRFTVVILPVLDYYENWASPEKQSREEILRIVQKLRIRYIDLMPVITEKGNEKKRMGITVNSFGEDRWHPDNELAELMAKYLYDQGIF